jgi:tetratricopeptide (TPR) repeat protein
LALSIIPSHDPIEAARLEWSRLPKNPQLQSDRLLPLALPAFRPSFQIERDDLIFTVGSCFARNIESQMAIEGFNVAAKDFRLSDEEAPLRGQHAEFLNKFSCFTILQEIKWSLGEGDPYPDSAFHEVQEGRWSDPQLMPTLRPVPLEAVRRMRAKVQSYFARIKDARVVVMTLGLAEVWFDKRVGLYLNGTVHKALLAREPERFEVRILDYNEILAALEELHDLLVRRGPDGIRILITVSPVALGTTFSGRDALIANTYSKAVQRAAVEAFVYKYDDVDYFPSFESVTLSDRRRAWRDDQAHASDELVRLNVLRMMRAYTRRDDDDITSNVAEAYEAVRVARVAVVEGRVAEADASFVQATKLAPEEGLIRKEYGAFLLSIARISDSVSQLETAVALGAGPYGAFQLFAVALIKIRHFDRAYSVAMQLMETKRESAAPFKLAAIAAEKLGRRVEAAQWVERAIANSSPSTPPAKMAELLQMRERLTPANEAKSA